MKRFIAVFVILAVAGTAFAGDYSGVWNSRCAAFTGSMAPKAWKDRKSGVPIEKKINFVNSMPASMANQDDKEVSIAMIKEAYGMFVFSAEDAAKSMMKTCVKERMKRDPDGAKDRAEQAQIEADFKKGR